MIRGLMVGLMGNRISCCVHLLIVYVPVRVPTERWACFVCSLCSESPTPCGMAHNVPHYICNLISREFMSLCDCSIGGYQGGFQYGNAWGWHKRCNSYLVASGMKGLEVQGDCCIVMFIAPDVF